MIDRDASLREAQRLEDSHGASDPYAAALRATRMPIVITDAVQPDLPIVFANRAFMELTGYTVDEIIGRNCRFLQGPGTDRAQVAKIREAIDARRDVVTEILNYRKDGSTFWNALYISPVHDGSGRCTHFFASQLDVTLKNQTARELRDANEQLAHAKEAAEALVEERTRDLRFALEQKTMLLHEVDHRVKNNLQLIASLILLQARRIPDEGVKKSLRSMLDRVTALATVHRKLYQSDDVAMFDVADFVRDIATDLVGATGRDDIRLEFALEPVVVLATQAAPLSLMVNELLTNALKHAFPDQRPGRIRVSSTRVADDFVIEIADDGVGRFDGFPSVGFGHNLINLLSRQLSARIERSDADPGVRVRLKLPVEALTRTDRMKGM